MIELEQKLNDILAISCPVCGDTYTHHSKDIKIYEREREDQETHVTNINNADQKKDRNNPSKRRDAISIYLNCELGHKFIMDITQHKGRTLIEFAEDINE